MSLDVAEVTGQFKESKGIGQIILLSATVAGFLSRLLRPCSDMSLYLVDRSWQCPFW